MRISGTLASRGSRQGPSNRRALLVILAAVMLVLAACEPEEESDASTSDNGDDTEEVREDTADETETETEEEADESTEVGETATATPTEAEPTATPTETPPTPTPEPTATPEPTPTPEPTSTPEPTQTPEPTPTPEPAEPAIVFSDGTFIVGEDIQPGIYFANAATDACYWERLNGFGGTLDEINANSFGGGRQIVRIDSTDAGFVSERCGQWVRDAEPVRNDPNAPLGDGIFLVDEEITPGTWRNEGSTGSCYWARLSSFSRNLDSIKANNFGGVGDVVQISPSDVGFESSDCGTWVRIGG